MGFTPDYYRGEGYYADGWGYGRGDNGPTRPTHFGKGPKGYKRSDERIMEDVSQALTDHHDIDASDMEVAVKDGEVTLTGTVERRDTKRLAERVVEHVAGVTDVHNQLRLEARDPVSPPAPTKARPH